MHRVAESLKSEFMFIIVEKARTVVEEAKAEQARQLELAAEEKAALLRLKWGELKKAAKDCGVTEQESQGIEDAENPNEALACYCDYEKKGGTVKQGAKSCA